MLKTCALVVIESTEETSTPGTVAIQIDCYTQWVCVRLATSQTITNGDSKGHKLKKKEFDLYI